MAYRLIQGIAQRDEPLALGLFEGFESGSQFLTMPHTRKWYRAEHIFPVITDRETYDGWAALGKKTIAERASEEAARLLQPAVENLPRRSVRHALKEIMLREAKSAGLAELADLSQYY